MIEEQAMLSFDGVSKRFGGQLALDDVSFSVDAGEVHALVGENGAGKSTLIKILSGEYVQDSGTVTVGGAQRPLGHPWERRKLGVGFIHQDPALFPNLSVAENIVMSEGFGDPPASIVRWHDQYDVASEALGKVGLGDVDPRQRLDVLSVAERQLVAIASILVREQRVVVFDEPTASLTQREAGRLFALIRKMKSEGVCVLYVSHRMEEIFAMADRVTVLKDGRYVTTRTIEGLTPSSLAALIIGQELEQGAERAPHAGSRGDVVLSARGLRDSILRGVDLDIHQGEILGLAGLAGAGRSNVLRALFGASDATGTITFMGKDLVLKHPADAIRCGIVMVTEERKADGFIPAFSVWKNLTLPWLKKFSGVTGLRLGKEIAYTRAAMDRFDVRAESPSTDITALSGGNQQKAILARWLSGDFALVLLDEPTHGVDVGAKGEIYQIVRRIAETGVPVVVVSSELEELDGFCDRVLVMVRGRVVDELVGEQITKAAMLSVIFKDRGREEEDFNGD